jgi:hypothetical protein
VTPRESLQEAAITAWRSRDASGAILPHPAWADLDEAGRREAYEAILLSRAIEASVDPDGLSTTAHTILARIRRPRRS